MVANWLESFSEKFGNSLPPHLQSLREELSTFVEAALKKSLAGLEIVGREEFDIQTKVLLKTRQKVEHLEEKVQKLESLLSCEPSKIHQSDECG